MSEFAEGQTNTRSIPVTGEMDTVKPQARLMAHLPALLLLGLFALLLTVRLSSTPPLWWDEGWSLALARNWVEQGYYGHLLAGQPTTQGMGHAFPVNAMIALSFRLFGIGIWQARLVGVVFTLGALALVYHLAGQLYNRSVAMGTLAVLLLMSSHEELHPVLLGRQVLAETPMLFFLLAGYACFRLAWDKPQRFVPLAMIFWGIGLEVKAQPLPFWIVSLLIPSLVALFKRHWKSVGLLGIGFLGSLMVSKSLVKWAQQLVLRDQIVTRSPTTGIYDVTALVPIGHVRLAALLVGLILGMPTMLGLCYAIWKAIRNRGETDLSNGSEVVRLALLVLAGSWFAWYVLLSVGWIRYLFPATFIGSIFVAALLYALTDHLNLLDTIQRSARAFRRPTRQNAGALLAILLITIAVPFTLRMLHQSYTAEADASVLQAADFLNTQTEPDALIETYDSELFFLLDRPYHYPPNQVHVELNRRTFLKQDVPINYDPLAADPDYLVVGPFSRMWGLYADVLSKDHFTLWNTIGRYAIYQRQR